MADQAERLKTITNNIEGTWRALRRAAANITGLLRAGKATCEEVRAYNLWAVATYNTQRGMLATLRANGEKNIPELPPAPTLFAWKGVQGAEAWKINCTGQAATLSGAMMAALRGPAADTQYLSTHEVAIVTQDQFLTQPDNAPSFAELAAQTQQQQLGIAWALVIIIAAIAVTVTVSLVAIMKYLEASDIQESNTKQTQAQADAFAAYTAARLSCFASCTAEGKSAADCAPICAKLVDKPAFFKPGGPDAKWGTLQWIGFTVVAGAGTMLALKIWQRKQSGRPFVELPDLDGALAAPRKPREPRGYRTDTAEGQKRLMYESMNPEYDPQPPAIKTPRAPRKPRAAVFKLRPYIGVPWAPGDDTAAEGLGPGADGEPRARMFPSEDIVGIDEMHRRLTRFRARELKGARA